MPKTVLITGCSKGGIGDALAREFHARGLTVFATARNTAKMTELVALGITTLEMDVISIQSITAAAAIVRRATDGKLDILVNNAGIIQVMPFADSSLEDMKHVIDTNVLGVFSVTHTFLPLLLAAGGLVANIGSIATVVRTPYMAAYNVSKAALDIFGHTLRQELAPLGVRVVTVKTGVVKTHIFEKISTLLPKDSLYMPTSELLESRDYLGDFKYTEVADYARQVVTDLLQDKPKAVYWRGAMSTTSRLIDMFGCVALVESHSAQVLGLNKLRPPVHNLKATYSSSLGSVVLLGSALFCGGVFCWQHGWHRSHM